jgi:hypothetical protein
MVEETTVLERARIIEGGRVGAYRIVRQIARAPGAWLFEGRAQEETPVLLQIARLKDAASDAELVERDHFQQTITAATAAALLDLEVCINEHGGAFELGGGRILYWVMPWSQAIRDLLDGPLAPKSALELTRIARSLLFRLVRRHALDKADPHLTEHVVYLEGRERTAAVAGAPIHLPALWLASDTIPARLAPEESLSERVTKEGDLWRLGQLLSAIASGIALPADFEGWLQSLRSVDPAGRPPRASQAMAELEALEESLIREASAENRSIEQVSATVSLEALSIERFSELLLQAAGDSTTVEPTLPIELFQTNDLTEIGVTTVPVTAVPHGSIVEPPRVALEPTVEPMVEPAVESAALTLDLPSPDEDEPYAEAREREESMRKRVDELELDRRIRLAVVIMLLVALGFSLVALVLMVAWF